MTHHENDLDDIDDDQHRIDYDPDDRGGRRIVSVDREKGASQWPSLANARTLVNGGAVVMLLLALLMLFAGYSILTHYRQHSDTSDDHGLAGTNRAGQVGSIPGVHTESDDPDSLPCRLQPPLNRWCYHHEPCIFRRIQHA